MAPRKTTSAKPKKAQRTARRRNQTASEILDAAREVVLREGYLNFSLGAVADELGLTTPAIYYYFDSRERLLGALQLQEILAASAEVERAVDRTDSGVGAVEAVMRTVFARYRDRLDLFSLAYSALTAREVAGFVGPEELERVRPTNEMLYGGAERRLRADQERGLFPADRDPRRFVFTAHLSVLGILNLKAITEPAGDALIHSDDALIDDMCRTFREAAQTRSST